MEQDRFHTLKGYQMAEGASLTPAQEDYLEMICRMARQGGAVRVSDLSARLHVRPPSATKMVQQLGNLGYLLPERYGGIRLTEKGKAAGDYLLYRHRVVHRFLCRLKGTTDELEETEKIEHFLSPKTVSRMAARLREDEKKG